MDYMSNSREHSAQLKKISDSKHTNLESDIFI